MLAERNQVLPGSRCCKQQPAWAAATAHLLSHSRVCRLAPLRPEQDGFAVGGALTVADISLYDMTEFYLRKYGAKFGAAYPALVAHHAKIAGLPRIAAYLASPLRCAA